MKITKKKNGDWDLKKNKDYRVIRDYGGWKFGRGSIVMLLSIEKGNKWDGTEYIFYDPKTRKTDTLSNVISLDNILRECD